MNRLIGIITSVISLLPWVYALLQRFTGQDWIMLIIDVIIPPIGVIDGIGLFLGIW